MSRDVCFDSDGCEVDSDAIEPRPVFEQYMICSSSEPSVRLADLLIQVFNRHEDRMTRTEMLGALEHFRRHIDARWETDDD